MTELVGNTPIIELSKLAAKYKCKGRIFAKCEFFNPLFSVKDRIALRMIEDLEKAGKISEETILVEATSGNTGIALAAISAAKGYKMVIIMPENFSVERRLLMEHFGAEVILTPAEDGMKGAIAKADLLAKKNNNVILLQQFENPSNPDAHRFGTSIEILEDMKGEVDAFVAGVGTAGTLTGTASTLRTANPDLYVVAVEPAASPVLLGGNAAPHKISGIGANFVPKFYDPQLVNEVINIQDEDAIAMATIVAQTEGLDIGISAGAALSAAITLAQRPTFKNKNVVVVLADAYDRYLSQAHVK